MKIFANLDEALNRIKDNSVDLSVTTILNWVYMMAGIVAVGYIIYGESLSVQKLIK